MALTFIYVLISDETDIYYEQCYISAMSLRENNKISKIVILTDSVTERNLSGDYRGQIRDVVDEIKVVDIPDIYTKVQRSRYIKTSIRDRIDGDFIYIDTDTIIARFLDAPENISLGFVHEPSNEALENSRMLDAKCLGWNYTKEDNEGFVNSGVCYCRETHETRLFFKTWHELWKECVSKGINRDQPSLNQTRICMRNIVQTLDPEWNVFVGRSNIINLNTFINAKILHLIGEKRTSKENIAYFPVRIWHDLKNDLKISIDTLQIIQAPLKHTANALILPSQAASGRIVLSNEFHVMRRLYEQNKSVYFVLTRPFIIINKFMIFIKRIGFYKKSFD